jgi:ribosomal protein L6P/L9E
LENIVDEAKAILRPLGKVHGLRKTLKTHSSVEEKDKEERQARAAHETLRAHLKNLSRQCDKSFDTIMLALGMGNLNP